MSAIHQQLWTLFWPNFQGKGRLRKYVTTSGKSTWIIWTFLNLGKNRNLMTPPLKKTISLEHLKLPKKTSKQTYFFGSTKAFEVCIYIWEESENSDSKSPHFELWNFLFLVLPLPLPFLDCFNFLGHFFFQASLSGIGFLTSHFWLNKISIVKCHPSNT